MSKIGDALREVLAERAATVERDLLEKEVARRLALIDAFGDDPYMHNDVIRFVKMHDVQGERRAYTYAALKVEDRWYLTGVTYHVGVVRPRKPLSWDELIEFIVGGEHATEYVIPLITGVPRPVPPPPTIRNEHAARMYP